MDASALNHKGTNATVRYRTPTEIRRSVLGAVAISQEGGCNAWTLR